METSARFAKKSEPLLAALSFLYTAIGMNEWEGTVRCLQFPQIHVQVPDPGMRQRDLSERAFRHAPLSPEEMEWTQLHQKRVSEAFEEAHRQARQLLSAGERPRYGGSGKAIWEQWKVLKPAFGGGVVSILVPDEWCLLSRRELEPLVRKNVKFWASYSGKGIEESKRTRPVDEEAMCRSILRRVAAYRPKFAEEAKQWEMRWENAQREHAEQMRNEEIHRQQLQILVQEALRYVSEGGVLRVPWMLVPEGNTPAETWLLYAEEQFNSMAREPVVHEEEEKDANGVITSYRRWVENPHGGELKTAAEQAKFMVGRMGRRAQNGGEDALRWLVRMTAEAIRWFWVAVEAQPEMARKISKEWRSVPVLMNAAPISRKELKKKLTKLDLAKPPDLSANINPLMPFHDQIGRIVEAVSWLLSQPPVTFPFSDIHEDSPDWLKDAWRLTCEGCTDGKVIGRKVFWKVRLAAEQASRKGGAKPLTKRPEKERERFVEAVEDRIGKRSKD